MIAKTCLKRCSWSSLVIFQIERIGVRQMGKIGEGNEEMGKGREDNGEGGGQGGKWEGGGG